MLVMKTSISEMKIILDGLKVNLTLQMKDL